MKIITIDQPDWLEEAVETLRAGGIVLLPTDTAYGLAVDATNVAAITRVYELKKRDQKPLIIVIRDAQHADEHVELNDVARRLMQYFFPGPLTLVLPKKEHLPHELTGGRPTVGIRQPDSIVTRQISVAFDRPYTSTSANLSGGPTPYSVDDALAQLDHTLIDLVIDAGPLPKRPTSTVVDLTVTPPQILRKGPIGTTDIFEKLSDTSRAS